MIGEAGDCVQPVGHAHQPRQLVIAEDGARPALVLARDVKAGAQHPAVVEEVDHLAAVREAFDVAVAAEEELALGAKRIGLF